MDNSYITPEQLAERWKVKVATLKQWRWNGKGPIYTKVGNCIFYWPNDIDAYEKSNRRRHTSDPPMNLYKNTQNQTAGKSPHKYLSEIKKGTR